MSGTLCGAQRTVVSTSTKTYRCDRSAGHPGKHVDLWHAQPWADADPPLMSVFLRWDDPNATLGYDFERVTIPAVCSTCGGPRGIPRHGRIGSKNGDEWENPCGHVETTQAMREEARAFAAARGPVTGDGRLVVKLSTLQWSVGGLFDSKTVPGWDVCLVTAVERGGTPGPTLCGIDRFRKDPPVPGWSVGGGVRGPGIENKACKGCAAVAREKYPDLPVYGTFSGLFTHEAAR